jgi:hypothetical protein
MIRRFVFAAFFLFATAANAQEGYIPIQGLRLGDFALNLPTTRVLSPGTMELRFTHRFAQPINEGNINSLWGLDSSADVAFGLAYSPSKAWQVAIFRTNLLDDVEATAKYSVLQQAPAVPVSIAVRGGIDWRTEEGLSERVSPFVQLIVSKQFGRKVEVFAVPSYIIDDPLFDTAFNIPFGVAYAVSPAFMIVGEIVPENQDAPDDADIGWAIGLKRAIGGHWFELVLADSRATHVDQYLSSAPLGGIDAGDIHLGFNIERRFGGRRR